MPIVPGSPAWQRDASHSTVLDYHLSMLRDTARMDAFRRAIDASVRPGDVVVDLGCGSGVLSFMACEAGARTVYAIEGYVKRQVPEWGGQWVQVKLEQGALFDGARVVYLAGRQTEWHVVR